MTHLATGNLGFPILRLVRRCRNLILTLYAPEDLRLGSYAKASGYMARHPRSYMFHVEHYAALSRTFHAVGDLSQHMARR
jgi:hypothetical protein